MDLAAISDPWDRIGANPWNILVEGLAADLGTSTSELTRLGIRWVLSLRKLLMSGSSFLRMAILTGVHSLAEWMITRLLFHVETSHSCVNLWSVGGVQ